MTSRITPREEKEGPHKHQANKAAATNNGHNPYMKHLEERPPTLRKIGKQNSQRNPKNVNIRITGQPHLQNR
jgi:hypothetical protein